LPNNTTITGSDQTKPIKSVIQSYTMADSPRWVDNALTSYCGVHTGIFTVIILIKSRRNCKMLTSAHCASHHCTSIRRLKHCNVVTA